MSEDAEASDDIDLIGGKTDVLLVAGVIAGLTSLFVIGGILLDFTVRQHFNTIGGLLFYITLFAMLALALNLHWGYTGLLNIGVIGFMAVGIYTTAVLSKAVSTTEPAAGSTAGFGLPLWIGIIGGVIAAALVGGLVALPALRLRADYFAIVTVGVSEIIRFTVMESELQTIQIAGYWTGLGGGSGLVLDFSPTARFVGFFGLTDAYAAFANNFGQRIGLGSNPKPVIDSLLYALILVVFLVGFYALLRRIGNSPFGRVLKAIREDEEATKSLGKNTDRFKVTAFMIGCGLMGLGGILLYGSQGAITPSAFRPRLTFFIFIALIIGGAGSNTGSVLGGAVFAALLFEGPLFLKNLIKQLIEESGIAFEAPADFAEALAPVFSSADIVPMFLYVVDNLNQFRFIIMGVVLIVIMQRRPEGMLGHRKEPASPIPLTRRVTPDAGGSEPTTADGGPTANRGENDE